MRFHHLLHSHRCAEIIGSTPLEGKTMYKIQINHNDMHCNEYQWAHADDPSFHCYTLIWVTAYESGHIACSVDVRMRIKIINHAKEKTWSLSWYSGRHLGQLMELNAQYDQDTLVQFLQHVTSTNENQTWCSCDDRVWGEFFRFGYRR